MSSSSTGLPLSSHEENDDGSKPLEPDEKAGLIPSWLTFRHELNEIEQTNIAKGLVWAMRLTKRRELLDDVFMLELHRRMFGEVWTWAGTFRSTERNLGIAPWQISTSVRSLVDDARTWIAAGAYDVDEIAVRFHHRLASIHPFANGNGRHSRLMADLLVRRLGRPMFSWGGKRLVSASEDRQHYIKALQLADRGDCASLLEFARS